MIPYPYNVQWRSDIILLNKVFLKIRSNFPHYAHFIYLFFDRCDIYA